MPQFSKRTADLHASPIREILTVISRPGMISFAGGLPAAQTFPMLDLSQLPSNLLQYGASEGEQDLREQLAREMQQLGLVCEAGQILILSGSQQGIDLVAKLFVDKGTRVMTENPTYLAALQVFRYFGAELVTLDPNQPALTMAEQGPALCYAVPTFQNPTGHCYTQGQRQALAQACMETATVLFEDDPYRELVYDPCDRAPICSFMEHGSWIYQGSFSKTFAPGLRLGFLVCSQDLLTPLTRLKQAADLHSNRVSQHLVLQALRSEQRDTRSKNLQAVYKQKRDEFSGLLNTLFADLASWETPKGGLFFWLRLNKKRATASLLQKAIEKNVAFMPGEPFFQQQPECSYVRLNFSHASAEEQEQGLTILANLLRQQS